MIPVLIAGVVGAVIGGTVVDSFNEAKQQNKERVTTREVPDYMVPANIRRQINEYNRK